ncbi:MAG: sugar phosphate nucleotidyltransferase [Verrucomicrobiota bacterium]
MRKIRTAFILGAGLGTRLRPLTLEWPKPLLPVAGRPMICDVLDRCVDLGVERILINTHHCAKRYDEVFPEKIWRGVPLFIRHEPILLETAGGLKNIEDLILGDSLLIYNGDVLANFDLAPLISTHFASQAEVSLGLRTQEEPRQVGWDRQTGNVRDIRGKLGVEGLERTLFTGVYVVERSFLSRLTPGKIESVVDVFLRMLGCKEDEHRIQGVLLDDRQWMDLGTIADYERVKALGL